MRENRENKQALKYLAVLLSLVLTGCGTIGLAQESTFESAYENGKEAEPAETEFVSACRGVLVSVNTEDKDFVIHRTAEDDDTVLSYTGATVVQDQYESPLTMEQLTVGEILDVAYDSESGRAGSIAISRDAFCYEGLTKCRIDEGKGTLETGNEVLRVSGQTRVFSEGREIGINEILNQDTVTVRGIGHDVSSIVIENGHGYLSLKDADALLGGWIEVGQAVISQITQEMFLTVPEGSYQVRLTAGDVDEAREVTIKRNEESVLDLGDIELKVPVNGQVRLVISPSTATVRIDDVTVNAAYAVRLPFGMHQITASADGYDTVSEYFEVTGEDTRVKLTLGRAAEDTVSGNSTKEETPAHTVTIKAPEDVEVYQDNLYMGISPVTYNKTVGTHTISLRKSGYQTKSYQIEVTDDDRDLVYSFPDLEKNINENTDASNTVSGNSVKSQTGSTVSGNTNTVSGNTNTVSGNETSPR